MSDKNDMQDSNVTDVDITMENIPNQEVIFTENPGVVEDADVIEDEKYILEKSEQLYINDRNQQISLIASGLRYSKDITAIVATNVSLTNSVLFLAEKLEIELPVFKYNNSGETVSYKIRVTTDGSYDNLQMNQIVLLIKNSIVRKTNEMNAILGDKTKHEASTTAAKKEIDELKLANAKLRIVIKHPTIEQNSYVIACLSSKGNFIYLGNKFSEKKQREYQGQVKDFGVAVKFANITEAQAKLIELLQNFNHPLPLAYRMNIYTANLIIADLPGSEMINKLRVKAEEYENLMKASDEKVSKKKSKNFSIKLKLKPKSKSGKKPKLKI